MFPSDVTISTSHPNSPQKGERAWRIPQGFIVRPGIDAPHFYLLFWPEPPLLTAKGGLAGNVIFFQGENETMKTNQSQVLLLLPQLPQSNQLSILDSSRTYCPETVFFGL